MDTTTSFIAIALLLVANGFYVAAEFALVKARGFRIESLATEGSAAARLTLRIQRKLEAYLAACQLGITMASLGLGWVGEPAVAAVLEPLFHSAGLSETAVHTTAFLVRFSGFLLTAHRDRRAGAQDLRHPQGRTGVTLGGLSTALFLPGDLAAELAAESWRQHRSCLCSGCRRRAMRMC